MKPVMNYVLACLTLLQNGTSTLRVKARGRAISKAVDVAQIVTNRFGADVSVKTINVGTEEMRSNESGETSNVSSIEIVLAK
jgi:DNA-binding protein